MIQLFRSGTDYVLIDFDRYIHAGWQESRRKALAAPLTLTLSDNHTAARFLRSNPSAVLVESYPEDEYPEYYL